MGLYHNLNTRLQAKFAKCTQTCPARPHMRPGIPDRGTSCSGTGIARVSYINRTGKEYGLDQRVFLPMNSDMMCMSPRRVPASPPRIRQPRSGPGQDRARELEDDRHHPFSRPHPRKKHHPQKKPALPPRHTPHPEPPGKNEDIGPYADRPRPAKIVKKVSRTGKKP
jgi:hypothetical protein